MPVCEPGKHYGILGGSFDPVHNGHISLAVQILQLSDLHGVLFVPALHHPFKSDSIIADYAQRRTMLRLAIEAYPEFQICDIERDQNLSGYTLDTVRAIKQLYPECSFSFIVGDDLVAEISRWKDYEQILDELTLYIGRRLKDSSNIDQSLDFKRIKVFETSIVEVSATAIKASLAEGDIDRIGELVPPEVADYIRKHGLYQ